MNNRAPHPQDPEIIYVPKEPGGQRLPAEDLWAGGKPHERYDPLAQTRYHHIIRPHPRRRWRTSCCLFGLIVPVCLLLTALLVFMLFPGRTNVLLLGLDARPGEAALGRSDTMILTTFMPLKRYIGVLSIPRDLWVTIPGVGENRINAAHFFAEANQTGSGPDGTIETIRSNFGVDVDYYVRIRFDDFQDVVDAMGGVEVDLPEAMSGYPAGRHHLNGEQALALVRDRQGSDDFFRMERGQIFLKSVVRQSMKPASWPRLPQAYLAARQASDTNLPPWHWPRLALTLLLTGPDNIDSRTINRDMVVPFTTSQGAQVLNPRWDQINPMLLEMFGQ